MTENGVHGQSAGPSLRAAVSLFCLLLGFSFWGVTAAWRAHGPADGPERQMQTLVSARFIQLENDFSPVYATPVLGRPWALPVEFPLYEWTAVALSNVTGMDLFAAGRLVSLLCFYLALPALYLLVREAGLPPGGGWLVLGLLAGNAFYIGQAGAFLVENMALGFSAWFLVSYIRALQTHRAGWLLAANLAGAAAGLTKGSTFFIHLLPAACWTGWWLWRGRGVATTRRSADLGWLVAAVALPCAAAWGWGHFAADLRRLSPGFGQLRALGFEGGDFPSDRVSRQLGLIGTQVVWWPLLVAGGALALTFSERWWRQVALLTACFLAAQVWLPVIEARHVYQEVAAGVLLLAALGFVLAGLFEPSLPRWAGPLAVLLFCAGQASQFFPAPRSRPVAGSGQFGRAIRLAVPPGDYLAVIGANRDRGLVPYLTDRRALVLTPGQLADGAAAFATLRDDQLGAVVVAGSPAELQAATTQVTALTGQALRPVFTSPQYAVYLPTGRIGGAMDRLMQVEFPDLVLAPESLPPVPGLAGGWKELDKIWAFQRRVFQMMTPPPTSFFSSFGPASTGQDGELWYNAHPVTRLRFRLPAGEHRLHTHVMIQPGAFDPALPAGQQTDGVEFQLVAVTSDGSRTILYDRLIDPQHKPADRQPQAVDLGFSLPAGTELELFFGPGPAGNLTRDWIYVGPLSFD